MLDIVFFGVYIAFGMFAYSNDVFDHESANLVDAITYTLLGGLIIAIRVFRNAVAKLRQELEGVQTPQFVKDGWNSVKTGAKNLYNSI